MAVEGTLKGPFNDRGFTFVEADPSAGVVQDVFLHIAAIVDGEDSKLFVRGARVEFEVVTVTRGTEEKPQARNVRLIDGGSVPPTASGTMTHTGRRGRPKFWHGRGYGFVIDEDSGEEYYVGGASVPGGYLRAGDIVEFDVEAQADDRLQAVNVRLRGWESVDEHFADLLDMGHPRWASQLAEIAETEPWNYPEKPSPDPFVILRSYIKHTFLRLNELSDHVPMSEDESSLSFNTGLVTPFQEQIFAVFRRRPAGEAGPPWVLKGFEKASSVSFLRLFGGRLPLLARYYDDPSLLVYDTRIPLSVNVEHVPHDPARFPEALNSLTPQDLSGLVNAKAPEAIERVRRNYKTAIPQFYRDGKSGAAKMQLLLPVALLRRDVVELALAVDRPAAGVYLGRTVLTLDWAYNNARLLTRPDTDWLRP